MRQHADINPTARGNLEGPRHATAARSRHWRCSSFIPPRVGRRGKQFLEHDFFEFFQGSAVLFGAEHRALPGIDQKGCEHDGVAINADFAMPLFVPYRRSWCRTLEQHVVIA
jgi:hypothetical protein